MKSANAPRGNGKDARRQERRGGGYAPLPRGSPCTLFPRIIFPRFLVLHSAIFPPFRSRRWEAGSSYVPPCHPFPRFPTPTDLFTHLTAMLGLNTMTNMLRQAPKLTRGLSTSAVRNDVSRMILVGRLANTPDVRQTANGNEYAVYTVATRDPSRPSSDPQNATSSYHRVFAFGDNVNRVRRLLKGSPVYVEADFRVERVQVAEDKLSEKIFTNHRMSFFLVLL